MCRGLQCDLVCLLPCIRSSLHSEFLSWREMAFTNLLIVTAVLTVGAHGELSSVFVYRHALLVFGVHKYTILALEWNLFEVCGHCMLIKGFDKWIFSVKINLIANTSEAMHNINKFLFWYKWLAHIFINIWVFQNCQ